jgi:PAS domain-containing protein
MKKRFSETSDQLFFISGDGEMAALIREHDWSGTSIGSPENWSPSLRTTLGILLNSAFPMFLLWGKDLVCFYNDAFRPSLGVNGKHPAIGKRAKEVWEEIWDFAGSLIDQVQTTGKPVWYEDQFVPFYRNGKVEDIYWTFSYSPVLDDNGSIGGLLITCTETTEKVRMMERLAESEKRFGMLVDEANVGVVVLMGEQLVVETVNEEYARIVGNTVNGLKGKPLFETLPEAEPYFRYIIDTVLKTGEPQYLYDHPYFVLVGGQESHGLLDLVYQPYRREGNIVSGVMVFCRKAGAKTTLSRAHDLPVGETANSR